MREIGSRIGAILKADKETVHLIGFGVYDGEQIPPKNINPMLHAHGIQNPKLVMDDGQVVWGCECWWASEEETKTMIGDRNVVTVDMAAERERSREVPPHETQTAQN